MVGSGGNAGLPPPAQPPLKSSFLENETKIQIQMRISNVTKKAERTKMPLIFLRPSYLFQLDRSDVATWGGIGQGASCLH